ncbi:hypothetical protein CVT25_015683 [Psilocybe cyanescens]|uniref:NACHT domain-containing protein n=1 Tax=Psilocybe cyanescens TaxID=93625 RepID=A0A409XJM0_PSICY|nr:hypothetical protein CVT25_015683 [Psilocybe cyanescens]
MALVATLAYQVSLNTLESREIIGTAIDKNPAIFQLNFHTQFLTLILDPLLRISSTGLFRSGKSFPRLIIIDGLDECKEYHLTTSFSVTPLCTLTFRLALNDTYEPDKDIRLYLIDSFRDIRKTHIMRAHLPDSWPSEEDIAELVAKLSGQFIYAATVIRYVSSLRYNPLSRLKVIQGLLQVKDDRPYAQLDTLYINILSEVEDVETVLRILGMVFVLPKNTYDFIRLLGVSELEKFMQLTPGIVQLLLLDLLSVVDVSDNNEPIKFLHASFSDFLVDPTRSHQFYINPSKRHEEAAYFCIPAIESKY